MSGPWRELLVGYASAALLLAVGYGLLRGALLLLAWLGRPLPARGVLRAGRATLALAVVLPLLSTLARGLVPEGPLFTFDRSVVRHTAPLPPVPWVGRAPLAVAPAPAGAGVPVGRVLAGLLGAACVAACARALWQHTRLLRRLEGLPRLRQVGGVAVAVSDVDPTAFSAWFPRLRLGGGRGPRAWVVVPSSTVADAEALRLTVLHELQHHRQRDTQLAFARLALAGAFFWNPAVHAFGRWLAAAQELACDEALVAGGKARPHAYARCLLDAALRASGAPPLPAGVTGMSSHPTTRRIEMLFQPHPHRPRRPVGLVAALALALTPMALWAQSAARGQALTLEQVQALARSSQPEGDLPVVVDAQVHERLNRLVGTEKGRAFMRRALENLKGQREALAGPLKARGLPEGLLAVAVIESAVTNMPQTDGRPSLAPGMRGAGVWMFIPETARRYGLTVDTTRDERLDVARLTEAAATLLAELHGRYGDWRLALAAYNQGERKVDRAIAEGGSRDASALMRGGHLNDYAATVQAGLLVLRNPHLLD